MTNSTNLPTLNDWLVLQKQRATRRMRRDNLDAMREFLVEDIGHLLAPRSTTYSEIVAMFSLCDHLAMSFTDLPVLHFIRDDEEIGLELYLASGPSRSWLVAGKITNGKPPSYVRIEGVIERGRVNESDLPTDKREPPIDLLPADIQGYQPFGQDPRTFTVWLGSPYWLHTFIDQLMYELRQY